MKEITKNLLITLLITFSSSYTFALSYRERLNNEKAAVAQSEAALKKCYEEIAKKENAKVNDIEQAQIQQTYLAEINELTEKHKIVLAEKDQTVFGLLEVIQRATDEANCKNSVQIDPQIYGEFLAKLAMQQFFEELKARSVQTILLDDELFWQYLYMSFPEFNKLLKIKDASKITQFAQHKANFFIQRVRNSMAALITNMGLSRAVTDVIIDENRYKEEKSVAPTMVQGEATNYIELHIAPANADGVSYNVFNKFDMTHLDGLLLINSPNEQIVQGGFTTGNDNLKFTLTDNPQASIIVIEIADPDPLAGTYLHGLMEVVGEKADVVINSISGVSMNGVFFKNIKSLAIKSHDIDDFSGCQSLPCARNIRVETKGLYADCSVTLNAKHVHIDGPIYIPEKILFFDVQNTCIFSKDGSINKLGKLDAVCSAAFINYGNINIEGPAIIETSNFINEAQWYLANWTSEMVAALHPETNRGYLQIDRWQRIPFDDIPGRQYEKMFDNSGKMLTYNYFINVTKGSFQNSNGAQIYATAPSPAFSQIVTTDEILNTCKKALNENGYLKQAFDFVPSIIDFAGDALFYSENNRIKNHASTININGNCRARAGADIINTNAEGAYFDYYSCKFHGRPKGAFMGTDVFKAKHCAMPGKGATCLSKHGKPFVNEIETLTPHYVHTNVPAIFTVQGNRSDREAVGNIHDKGSLYFVHGDGSDKAGGKYILEGRKIDLVSRQKVVDRVHAILSSAKEAIVPFSTDVLNVKVGNQPFSYFVFHGTNGKTEIQAAEGIDIIDGGIVVSDKNINMRTNGKFNLFGAGEAYVANEIHDKNKHAVSRGFVMQPAIVYGNENIDIESNNAHIHLRGGQVESLGNTRMCAKSITMEPFMTMAENFYSSKKKNFLGSSTVTQKWNSFGIINSVIAANQELKINADTLSLEGGILSGGLGTEINVDILKLKARLIDYYHITDATRKGFNFPGLGNIVIDLAKGDFTSKSIVNNIGIVSALDKLFKTESASDMAPAILAAAETYSIADGFAKEYGVTGSQMAAMTSTVLDQLQFTTVGGIPLPASLGYRKTSTHSESKWQEAILPIINGKDVKISAREIHVAGAQFEADQDFTLSVRENLYLHGQPIRASNFFNQNGKSMSLSFSNGGIGVSGSYQSIKSNSHIIHQILPKIIAGNCIDINISGNVEVDGNINAPNVKMKVGGELLLKTVQDVGQGKSSQKSTNMGISITPSGTIMPNGGFQLGKENWFKHWAEQQASITGTKVEIDVQSLILKGACILAQLGYVNAQSIDYEDILNTYENELSQLGIDTNFLNFVIDPKNALRIIASANAIKGITTMGNANEAADETLFSTISENLEIYTTSNIENLNRDESKSRSLVHESSHKFSLAVPMVDWHQLGEGLQRIGMTARDINAKILHSLESRKRELLDIEPEQVLKLEEVVENYQKISEKIEQSNLREEEKSEIAARIFLLFNGDSLESGQYFVYAELESGEQGTVKLSPFNGGTIEAIYQPNGGAILTIDNPIDYEKDTYKRVEELFGTETTCKLRAAKSKIEGIVHTEYSVGKGFAMAPIEALLSAKEGYIIIGELFFDIIDGTLMRDLKTFNALEASERQEIIVKVGTEMGHAMYEDIIKKAYASKIWDGVKEGARKVVQTWQHPRTQGTVEFMEGVGEMAAGVAVAIVTSETGVGVALGGAIVLHGADTASKGFCQAVGGQEQKSCTVQGLEFLGVPQQFSEPINTVLGAAGVIGGVRSIVKESIQTVTVAGKQFRGPGSKVSVVEGSPQGIGLGDKVEIKPNFDGWDWGKKIETAAKVKGEILKAGTEAGSGFKHHKNIDINLLKKEVNLPNDLNNPKLRAKFNDHGDDFGMKGLNFNRKNAELFKQNIRAHISSPETIPIAGEYTRGGVGDVVHYYNPTTQRNVMKDMNGDFISGWKLSEKQQKWLQETGKIGGDQ